MDDFDRDSLKEQKRQSWRLFNRIARRYDLLNRLLSFRRDIGWRRMMIDELPDDASRIVVDLATGTADAALQMLKRKPNLHGVIGIDPAVEMLAIAKKKSRRTGRRLLLAGGDALHLCLKDGSVDAVTMAFGIRNVADVLGALREIHRILKPNGRLFILEFSMPQNRFMHALYRLYLRHILPSAGGLISGDREAYRYLNVTIEDFPYGEEFCRRIQQVGFYSTAFRPLTFGIATLYTAQKGNQRPVYEL